MCLFLPVAWNEAPTLLLSRTELKNQACKLLFLPNSKASQTASTKVGELLSATYYQAKTQAWYLVTLAVYLVTDATLSCLLSTYRDITAGPAGSSSPGCLEPAYLVTVNVNVSEESCNTLRVHAGPNRRMACTQFSRKTCFFGKIFFPLNTASC